VNYATFKTFLSTFLWKQNDADLVANLDSLVRMADGELNRILDVQRRQKTLLILPEVEDYVLPADFRHIISLNDNTSTNVSPMSSTTLLDIYRLRHNTASAVVQPFYAVDEGTAGAKLLRLVGPFSEENPGSMTLVYRANVPDFAALDASWLEADFLDLYTYTILSHTAPFLREDERVQLWVSLKNDAIASAIAEDKHMVTHGGSPLQMRPHRHVP
jgi:hypothetical protein